MIVITSKIAGFRRGGVAHPAVATEYPDGHFTPEQLDALQAEPMLVVEVRPDKPEKPEKKKPDGEQGGGQN
jgi:hypothetical protein